MVFKIPLFVLITLFIHLFLLYSGKSALATGIILLGVVLGSYSLVIDTLKSLLKKRFALDYIALIAILVAVGTGEYIVAGILALMVSGGETLEAYSVAMAKKSLTALVDRIPSDVVMWIRESPGEKKKLSEVEIGELIFIPKGGVVPLDGELVSPTGETDESSLTGEPYFIEKVKGDLVRSGVVNIGSPMVLKVVRKEVDSTYHKIVDMVKDAQEEKSPLVRLADQYSTIFTAFTFVIASFAYFYSGMDLKSVLAVLAVATPCPLIIATPIALLGGVNASAKKHIIMKRLASIEALSRVNTVVFDKTGTITLGKPKVIEVEIKNKTYSEEKILQIAHAIERSSLHPFAKAIVEYAKEKKTKSIRAEKIEEVIGRGIEGEIDGKIYLLHKTNDTQGMGVILCSQDVPIAQFGFADEVKSDSKEIIRHLHEEGIQMHIFTGDKKEAAEQVAKDLGGHVTIKAECTPEDKQEGIRELKSQGKVTAMVGDGINDAPALALADVGMAYGNQEQTAATVSADIVFLGGDFSLVHDSWKIAKRSVGIAKQSIVWGIGLSVGAMLLAAIGQIPPIVGAGIQEAIDVAVILNALRASRVS